MFHVYFTEAENAEEPEEVVKDRLSRADFAEIVTGSDEATLDEFRERFDGQIETFLDNVTAAYDRLTHLTSAAQGDVRAAWVETFGYSALDNLVTSMRLLIRGLVVPAGNLVRQFGESSAMVLLCSHHAIDVVERLEAALEAEPEAEVRKFPIRAAPRMVARTRNSELLGIGEEGWTGFQEITKWYDRFSHTSLVGLGNLYSFSKSNTFFIGGGFDSAKQAEYEKEILLRSSAAARLSELFEHVEPIMLKAQEKGLIVRNSG